MDFQKKWEMIDSIKPHPQFALIGGGIALAAGGTAAVGAGVALGGLAAGAMGGMPMPADPMAGGMPMDPMAGGAPPPIDPMAAAGGMQVQANVKKMKVRVPIEKAQEVPEEYQKRIFLKLAEEEKKHYFLLENIIDFVSRPATWLENAEFCHLEEY